jgi:hypothetical protein
MNSRLARLDSDVESANGDGNVIESFEIARDGDYILLPVTVGREAFLFAVDTGSTVCIVDTVLSRFLTATGELARLNGQSDNPLFSIRDSVVGESRFPIPGPVICRDLSMMRQASGYDIRGILGMSFLRSHVIEIDFAAGRFEILKSAGGASGAMIGIAFVRCCPTIAVQLDSSPAVPFLIDTGCVGENALYIETAEFDALLERGDLNLVGPGFLSVGAHGVERHRQARIGGATISDFNHRDLLVADGRPNALTLEYLSRFRMIFDFPGSRVLLEPGGNFRRHPATDVSGLTLECDGGETKVRSVRTGSPAARAGIAKGDCITGVDDTAIAGVSMHQLRRILSSEDRLVRLIVRRSGQSRSVEFQLPSLPERCVIE